MEDQIEVVNGRLEREEKGRKAGEEGVLGCGRKGYPVFFMPFCPCPASRG